MFIKQVSVLISSLFSLVFALAIHFDANAAPITMNEAVAQTICASPLALIMSETCFAIYYGQNRLSAALETVASEKEANARLAKDGVRNILRTGCIRYPSDEQIISHAHKLIGDSESQFTTIEFINCNYSQRSYVLIGKRTGAVVDLSQMRSPRVTGRDTKCTDSYSQCYNKVLTSAEADFIYLEMTGAKYVDQDNYGIINCLDLKTNLFGERVSLF